MLIIKNRLTLGVILVLTAMLPRMEAQSSYDASELDATLYGAVESNETLLYWDLAKWPAWLDAFVVKRRKVGVSEWSNVSRGVIYPSVDISRDWNAQGLDSARIDRVEKHMRESFPSLSTIDHQSAIALFLQNEDIGLGMRLQLKRDYNFALTCGFACIDSKIFDADKTWEYGLFAIDVEGYESATPAAMWTAVDYANAKIPHRYEIESFLESTGIRLKWTMTPEHYKERSLLGFRLFRRDHEEGAEYLPLLNSLMITFQKGENVYNWQFMDTNAGRGKSYSYKIEPVDTFGREYPATEIEYIADLHRAIDRPVVKVVELKNDVDLSISWSIEEKDADHVKGFIVQRKEGRRFVAISPLLATNLREFLDTDEKEMLNPYTYRVVAIDRNDNPWVSNQLGVIYMGFRRPPPVEGLRAEFLMKDDLPHVKLNWDPIDPEDGLTVGYRLHSDEVNPGEPLLHGSLSSFKEREYLYRIQTNGARDYTFGISAVSDDNAESAPRYVSLWVPRIVAEEVENFQVDFDPEKYEMSLSWEYSKDLEKSISGFRILYDDEIWDGSGDLSPQARSCVIRDDSFARGNSYKFAVQVVGNVKDSSVSLSRILHISSDRLVESLEEPKGFVGKFVTINNVDYIDLSWDEVDLDRAGIGGYILFADYRNKGNVLRLGSVPLIKDNAYRYRVPEGRDSMLLRLVPINEEMKKGPYAQVRVERSMDARDASSTENN